MRMNLSLYETGGISLCYAFMVKRGILLDRPADKGEKDIE